MMGGLNENKIGFGLIMRYLVLSEESEIVAD
jgi:hypothetical protein